MHPPLPYGDIEDSLAELAEKVQKKELSAGDARKRLFSCRRKGLITVSKTGNSTCVFEMNTKAVDEARGKLGYFMILSTEDLPAGRVLDIYRAKKDIGFDRPAVKTESTMEGKVFIVMLAGMLSTHIRNSMRAHREELTRKMTYNKVLKELECMYTVSVKGRTTWCEISERQALILNCLGVPLPVKPMNVQAKLVKKREPKPKAK